MNWIVTPQGDSNDTEQALDAWYSKLCPGWLSVAIGLIGLCRSEKGLCPRLAVFDNDC